MTAFPDPCDLAWPRATARAVLRPVTLDDVDAVWAYRRLPEVVKHLSHDVLGRDDVRDRLMQRMPGGAATPGRVVRAIAMEVDGRVVGDGMLRVAEAPDGRPGLWVGYALHPSAWGRGLGTELAQALVDVGAEVGLPVWAEAYAANTASCRVLEKVGMRVWADQHMGGVARRVYRLP